MPVAGVHQVLPCRPVWTCVPVGVANPEHEQVHREDRPDRGQEVFVSPPPGYPALGEYRGNGRVSASTGSRAACTRYIKRREERIGATNWDMGEKR